MVPGKHFPLAVITLLLAWASPLPARDTFVLSALNQFDLPPENTVLEGTTNILEVDGDSTVIRLRLSQPLIKRNRDSVFFQPPPIQTLSIRNEGSPYDASFQALRQRFLQARGKQVHLQIESVFFGFYQREYLLCYPDAVFIIRNPLTHVFWESDFMPPCRSTQSKVRQMTHTEFRLSLIN